MANNTIGFIAFWGYIPKQTYLVEFASAHFLKRRCSLFKNNFSATSHQKTSLTIISFFSYLFQCYSIQHKKMKINTMEILRLKYATFVKSLTSFGHTRKDKPKSPGPSGSPCGLEACPVGILGGKIGFLDTRCQRQRSSSPLLKLLRACLRGTRVSPLI